MTPATRGIAHQLLADRGAGAVHVVEDAGGHARVADAVGEEPARPRRVGGALEDDGVAGHERRGGGAGRERDREIERRDDGPHAVGPHHALVARDEDVRRVVRQVELVALVRLEVVRVDLEEVHAFLRLAERLEAVLADLEHEGRRDVVDPLLEDAGDLAHQRDALREPASRQAGKARSAALIAASTSFALACGKRPIAIGCRSGCGAPRSRRRERPCRRRTSDASGRAGRASSRARARSARASPPAG